MAALRAGLGVAIPPKAMTPGDSALLRGWPALEDTEIALRTAPDLSRPARRLTEAIVRALEPTRTDAPPA